MSENERESSADESTVDDAAEPDESDAPTDAGDEADASAATGGGDERVAGDESEGEPPADLVERVESSEPEAVAREIASLREQVDEQRGRLDDLRERVDEREATIDELEEKLKRKQADFQNFKKRNERKLEQELERATEDLVVRLLDVRDNLARGLEQEGDIRDGVESTLRQLDDVLDDEGAERIAPDPGDEVDPQRHEVLMRVASDQPADAVADVHRPGYEMGGKVVRTAQVLVSDGTGDDGK